MIKTTTLNVPNEVEVICGDAHTINFILDLYPNKNIKFMSVPVGHDVNGTLIEAMSLKSKYCPTELPNVDDSTVSQLSDHVKSVLDEVFEFIGDKEVYLYCVVLGLQGSKVRAFFTR